MKLTGIGVSSGISIGPALLLLEEELVLPTYTVEDSEAEIALLNDGVDKAKAQLTKLVETTTIKLGADKAKIFESHRSMLEDPELLVMVNDAIVNQKKNAATALFEVVAMFASMFESLPDPYMRERAVDLRDVSERVIKNILNKTIVDLSALEDEVVLVAHDLMPSDTATLSKDKVLGFVTNIGGRTSHTAIMARTLEIPAVVGTKDVTSQVVEGDMIIMDGKTGDVIINPDEATLAEYRVKQEKEKAEKELLKQFLAKESVTADGRHIELAANIGTPADVEGVVANGGDAIGLYRTEFLYMHSEELPTEDEQFDAYRKVVQGMGGKPVIIRTLDIGGDKELKSMQLPKEMNPFLGYRAIRICLTDKELFKTQLRALLRASNYGKLRIMFPMISCMEEVRAAKAILEEVKVELRAKEVAFDENVEIGIMIEVPSAAVIADLLAQEVDFFSIGTNDLIQYTTAVDRMNEQIAYLYNPLNPAVIRLIKNVIDSAHKYGKFVGMCGEMAGDGRYIPLLVGLGLDELSMSASAILPARKLLSTLTFEKLEAEANKVLMMGTSAEIEAHIKERMI